jgi:hypothetical protein
MRRLMLLFVLNGGAIGLSGYLMPGSSAEHKEVSQAPALADTRRSDTDHKQSVLHLLDTSLDSRMIEDDGSCHWFTDQPSHMTIDRISGSLE